jgi:hypothetical protein
MNTLNVVTLCLLSALPLRAAADHAPWAERRQAAVNRARTVIYYNGGEEPLFWPKEQPFSVQAFLDQRIAPLKESKVDTLFYAPVSGFAYLSAKIPSADLADRQPEGSKWLANTTNVLSAFLAADTDPLRVVATWCKVNGKELFATLCLNNTHHGTEYDLAKPPPPFNWDSYLFPPFKIQHPEVWLGDAKRKPPYAVWSGVDYGEQAVREKLFENARDLCAGYEIDGLCLDFMREPQLFRSVAWGGKASGQERKLMTELVRRIRAAAEAEGQRRGQPILLAARVPDSLPYAKDIGIDLEAWLAEKLVDVVVAGGPFQLNPWTTTSALCKKAGVKFYASLDESGIWVGNDSGGHVDDDRLPRQCPETYRARVAEARLAGADGVLFANRYDEDWRRGDIKRYREWLCGDLAEIRALSKRYFVSYRPMSHAGRFLKEWEKYGTLSELTAYRPAKLQSGSAEFTLNVWDNLAELKKQSVIPELLLTTEAVIPTGTDLDVALNGRKLTLLKKQAGCQKFVVPPEALKVGANKVQVRAKGRNKAGLVVEVRNLALDVTFK